VKVSESFPYPFSVGRHDNNDNELKFSSGTVKLGSDNRIAKLTLDPNQTLEELNKGDFAVTLIGASPAVANGRVVQVQVSVPPKNQHPWEWTKHLAEIRLLDGDQKTYPCYGAAVKILPGGVPKAIARYDIAGPLRTFPENENRPADITLFFCVPRGTNLAGLQ